MAAPQPKIFFAGLRLLLSNKRTLLWSYLPLLVVGLIGGASMHARVGPFLDHSLAAQHLAGGIDIAYYAELFDHANEHNPGTGPVTAALTLISVLLSFFLAAGAIHIFLASEKARLATILGKGIEYFWRFFRLTLFAGIVAAPTLGILGWLRTTYLTRADENYVEAAYDLRALLTVAILVLVAVLLRLWFDLAEVYVVQLGRDGDRRVRRSLGPSLGLLRRHFFQVFASYFIAGTLGWLGLALFLWLWGAGQASHLILPVFLLSQVALLSLLAARIWQRAILAALVLAVAEPAQTVIRLDPGPPEPYPLTPVYSDPAFSESPHNPLPPAPPLGEPAA